VIDLTAAPNWPPSKYKTFPSLVKAVKFTAGVLPGTSITGIIGSSSQEEKLSLGLIALA
jgi:hypothetical protein